MKKKLAKEIYDDGYVTGYKASINEFLEGFKRIEEKMMFELKQGDWNDDIKNNTKDAKYWKGYSYGIQAFWGDFVIPEREKWEKMVFGDMFNGEKTKEGKAMGKSQRGSTPEMPSKSKSDDDSTPLKCDICELMATEYAGNIPKRRVCLHDSFRPNAPLITENFICPKEQTLSRDSEKLREIRENQKEECEHNRPFWECEICGNQKKLKEETPSKDGLFMIPTVFGTQEEMEKSHEELKKIANTIPKPDIEKLLEENNDPKTCNDEVDCIDCYHKEHCGDLPTNDDKKSTGLPDTYKPIQEISVRRKDYKKLKEKPKVLCLDCDEWKKEKDCRYVKDEGYVCIKCLKKRKKEKESR